MSLHALAGHMATKGRHGDSVLVHMAPSEVAGLHALARAHGEKLTINPETGLPEAFSLKSLLPTILGIALAPATGGASLGLTSAWQTAALVGAGFGLAKGSLKEGLLAGLGAYGGAGLGQSLAAAGVSEAAAQEAFKNQLGQQVALDAPTQTMYGAFGEAPLGAAADAATTTTTTASTTGAAGAPVAGAESAYPVAEVVVDAAPVQTTTQLPVQGAPVDSASLSTAGYTPPTGLEALQQGAQSIYDKGTFGDFAKANKSNLYSIGASAALAPEDEEGMPETKRDPGYIRPARYDWRTGKYEYFDPVKASEWGTRNLSEYTNPNDPRARTPLKNGGLTALANGGAIAFDDGGPVFVTGPGDTGQRRERFDGLLPEGTTMAMDPRTGLGNTVTTDGVTRPYSPVGGTMYTNAERSAMKDSQDLAARKARREAYAAGVAAGTIQVDPAAYPFIITEGDGQPRPDSNPSFVAPIYNPAVLPTAEDREKFGFTSPYASALANPSTIPLMSGETQEQGVARIKKMNDELMARQARREAMRGNTTSGGGGGGGSGGGGGGGGANPPVYTPPTDPYNPEPPVPTTPDITDVTTGGSRAAYEYLSGQGPYPTNPYLPTDPATGKPVDIGVPYWKAVGMTDPYKGPKPLGGVNDPNKMPTEPAGVGKKWEWSAVDKRWNAVSADTPTGPENLLDGTLAANGGLMPKRMALGGLGALAGGGSASQYNLGSYSDGGRLLKGPGDGVSDSIPATIGGKQPARLADGEFVVPARIVSELGNGSTEAGARKLYAMMDRVQKARGKTTGKNRVAANSRADKHLPA